MKRSEMLEHIEQELQDFIKYYNNASEKAKRPVTKSASDKILCMIEGFGMLPPTRLYEGIPPLTFEMPMKTNTWEPENE
jgi:hypothetical protein